MRLQDFRYELPSERIAQEPAEPRDASRLLVLDRSGGSRHDRFFRDLPELLAPGDLLVVNDTRVLPARLRGRKESGGRAEILLVSREGPGRWEALVRAAKRCRPGTRVELPRGARVTVLDVRGGGRYGVELEAAGAEEAEALLEEIGEVPLPPYIRREGPDARDRARYQTVFARPEHAGSAAAPTAGLHFTPAVLRALEARGVETAAVTLHVGLGTFLPVREEELDGHRLHREWYRVPEATALAVERARAAGRRVLAVGTTSARVLEHCGRTGELAPGEGWTDLFVLPGHEFRIVSGMLTNFHLPESTLLMLVCALAGTDVVLEAYRHAVEARYRFYSYGDAMLIL